MWRTTNSSKNGKYKLSRVKHSNAILTHAVIGSPSHGLITWQSSDMTIMRVTSFISVACIKHSEETTGMISILSVLGQKL